MAIIEIQRVVSLPFDGFDALLKESEEEGFRFLKRLKEEWINESNRFEQKGEGFYCVFLKKELAGVGGITIDPYVAHKLSGRLRRFYVKKSARKNQVGKKLLQFVLAQHKDHFDQFSLFTDNPIAANFYERNGFEKIPGQTKISHRKLFERD